MRKKDIMELQKKSDHDLLTTLVETVKNNQETVLEKIKEVKEKVKEVNDGINMKVNDHEIRLKVIEKIVQVVNPEQSFKELQDLVDWKKEFENSWKLTIAFFSVVSLIGGVVLTVMSISNGILKLSGK